MLRPQSLSRRVRVRDPGFSTNALKWSRGGLGAENGPSHADRKRLQELAAHESTWHERKHVPWIQCHDIISVQRPCSRGFASAPHDHDVNRGKVRQPACHRCIAPEVSESGQQPQGMMNYFEHGSDVRFMSHKRVKPRNVSCRRHTCGHL